MGEIPLANPLCYSRAVDAGRADFDFAARTAQASQCRTRIRNRLAELAHANRQATAGELTSTIAHELNQPLGAILTNTETAELILNSPSPDLSEVKEILADIRRDDIRAGEIIHHMRFFLRRAPFEDKPIELNDTVRKVFDFLSVQASARNVALYFEPSGDPIQVRGDQVQLQQVIMNLVLNSMDAMARAAERTRRDWANRDEWRVVRSYFDFGFRSRNSR